MNMQEELADGHVVGALNLPSGQFADAAAVDAFIEQQLLGKSKIVVHCKLVRPRLHCLWPLHDHGLMGTQLTAAGRVFHDETRTVCFFCGTGPFGCLLHVTSHHQHHYLNLLRFVHATESAAWAKECCSTG